MRGLRPLPPLLAAFFTVTASAAATATVGDLVRVRGVRSNHLVGLGLVVGLGGTGDGSPATREAIRRFSASCGFGAGLRAEDFAPENAALVAVTADLPPFLHVGQRLDVTVSACGGAKSLAGGTLVTTPLWAGSPEEAYVRAQGPISPGGGEGEATVGRVRVGGIVEREVPPVLLEEFRKVLDAGRITLDLRRPSPQAAVAIADYVAEAFPVKTLLAGIAAPSPGEVEITLGEAAREAPMRFLADVLDTRVEFEARPVIVMNERLGTVAAPGRIEIAPAAVTTGSLSVTIGRPRPGVSEGPAPVATLRSSSLRSTSGKRPLVSVNEGTELQELVRELQRMQVPPRDVIAVLDGLVKVGALRAEILVE